MPTKPQQEERSSDSSRSSEFGGKSREEWIFAEIDRLKPTVLQEEGQRRKERLISWPLIAVLLVASLLFGGVVIIPLLNGIDSLLHRLFSEMFGSSFGVFLLIVLGGGLLIVGFRALTHR